MADYAKGKNLATTILSPEVRVSTAYFPASSHGWDSDLTETWIFDAKDRITRQFFHRFPREGVRRHPLIVRAAKTELAKIFTEAELEGTK